jgi:hypothetical protein
MMKNTIEAEATKSTYSLPSSYIEDTRKQYEDPPVGSFEVELQAVTAGPTKSGHMEQYRFKILSGDDAETGEDLTGKLFTRTFFYGDNEQRNKKTVIDRNRLLASLHLSDEEHELFQSGRASEIQWQGFRCRCEVRSYQYPERVNGTETGDMRTGWNYSFSGF